MENESYEVRKGAIVYKSRPPLDVRIVAYYLYFGGFLGLALSLLISVGVAKYADDASRRVLLGTVVLASRSAEAVYLVCISGCNLFCAWGLMRRVKFAWWFTVIFNIYWWVDEALSFPRLFAQYPLNMVVTVVFGILLFAWLWYRRELYGVRLGASHTKK